LLHSGFCGESADNRHFADFIAGVLGEGDSVLLAALQREHRVAFVADSDTVTRVVSVALPCPGFQDGYYRRPPPRSVFAGVETLTSE
jgi:hypothetical protein